MKTHTAGWIVATLALAVGMQAGTAQATDYTWNGGTGNWNASNWGPGGPSTGPTTAGNTATINSGTVNVNVAGLSNVDLIIIGSGATLNTYNYNGVNTYAGFKLDMKGGTFAGSGNSGNYGAAALNAMTVSGSAASTISASSYFNISEPTTFNVGDVTGNATVDLTVSPSLRNTGWGSISGLTKTGAGTMLLSGVNTYTGKTIINDGTVKISAKTGLGGNPGSSTADALTLNGGTLQTTASITIDDANRGFTLGTSGGTFNVDPSTTFTVPRVIAGAGALTKTGTGKLTLSGNNTYTGNTTISSGTLEMASNLITNSPIIFIGDGATLNGTGGFTLKASQTVTGTGATGFVSPVVGTGLITAGNNIVSSSGTLTITRFSVLGSGNQITEGDIRTGGAGTYQRGLLVGNGGTGVLTITGGSLTSLGGSTNPDLIGHGNTGNGTLIINGGSYTNTASTGTLNLGTDSSHTQSGTLTITTGAATINKLVYNVGNASGSGIVNLDGGTLTLSAITVTAGATKQFNFNGGQFIAGAAIPAFSGLTLNVKNGGAKIDTSGYSFTISDPLLDDGTGGLTKSGTGTLTLSGANTYDGATTISGGTLSLTHLNAMQNSPLDTANSLVGDGSNGLKTDQSNLKLGGLSGNKNLADIFTTSSGGYGSVSTLTLNAGTGADLTYSGIIANGAAGMALTKTGAGSQTLSGDNAFTGATTVSDGTLLVNSPGSLHVDSDVSVTGGTLGGNGTINGNVTVGAAGSVAPAGDSAGTLAIGQNLDISALADSGSGKLKFGLAAIGSSDQITVGGTLTIGTGVLGFSDFEFTDLGGMQAGTYTLITSMGLSDTLAAGDLTGTVGAFSCTLKKTGNNLEMDVSTAGAPYVVSVSSALADGSYDAGTVIDIDVTFDHAVTVIGSPTLLIETGVTDREATYVGGTATKLTFRHTVESGDTNGELDYTDTDALALNLGSIKDSVNQDADLALPVPGEAGSLGDNKDIVIDTVVPTLAGTDIEDDKDGGTIPIGLVTYTVTFSEDMDAATLTAADFGNAGGASYSIGSITEPSPGEFSVPVTPTSEGTLQLKVNAGADVADAAGNALDTALAITDDTTLTITIPTLTWDANGTGGGQTDGGGTWLNANQWWNGSGNASWSSGNNAVFGNNSGTAGSVALASPTTVNSLIFNTFSSTYTLGTVGQSITLNAAGMTMNSGAGAVTFVSPITGSGSITVNGTGRLVLGASGTVPAHSYSGTTTINGGVTMFSGNTGNLSANGNIVLNGGILESYWTGGLTRALGTGANQLAITGGESGFGMNGNNGCTFNLGGTAIVWGSANFNPTKFVLQSQYSQNNSAVTFSSPINLSGADRTIVAHQGRDWGASSTLSGVLSNSTGTAGLIKEGWGLLILSGGNTFNGGVTLNGGTLRLDNAQAMGTNSVGAGVSGPLVFTGASTLNINAQSPTVAALSGTSSFGTITTTAGGARTFTVNQASSTAFGGVIQNGNGTLALTKSGSGSLTLSGTHTYTGNTTVSAGTLLVNGSTHADSAVAVNGTATLGGTGIISNSVTVAATATLQPGAPEGTLTITGSATIDGKLAITLDGSGSVLDVGGVLDLTGATLQVTGSTLSTVRVIAEYGSRNGTFGSNLILPPGWFVDYNYQGNKIALTGPAGSTFRFR